VLAVLCTRGHLNPPASPTCGICGREVPEQQAYETPRPPLGILRLSTGDVVVQVVVEGWQVILRDLDTTNGSTVTPPQGTMTRLRAGDPFVLEPGTVGSMADEVSFTYEVPAEAQQ
jgi:hypothetical protein